MWGSPGTFHPTPNLVKTLFAHAEQYVRLELSSGKIPDRFTINLHTGTAPKRNPFDPNKVNLPDGSTMTVSYSLGSPSRTESPIKATADDIVPGPPAGLAEGLEQFLMDYPDNDRVGFVMMQFGQTTQHREIHRVIRETLSVHGLVGLRADGREYHEDLFNNILTYCHGCSFGIAVFEQISNPGYNPNVALEVGYMFALRKPVCLLKDSQLIRLPSDLLGKLYRNFDAWDSKATIPEPLVGWLKDRGLLRDQVEPTPENAYSITYHGPVHHVEAFQKEARRFGVIRQIGKTYVDGTAEVTLMYEGALAKEVFDIIASNNQLGEGKSPHEGT